MWINIITLLVGVSLIPACGEGSDSERSKGTGNGSESTPAPHPVPLLPNQPLPDEFTSTTCYRATAEVCAIEAAVWERTNTFRQEGGFLRGKKTRLTFGLRLTYAARRWSEKVASGEERFGHQGFRNREAELAGAFTDLTGLTMAAENIAETLYASDPQQIAGRAMRSWLFSPGHRLNMLGDHQSLGVGAAIGANGKVYITQILGDDSLSFATPR